MTGPVYYSIWLFVGTLYPAYESFKAVKTKNTRNYVRWMMYWIVYATFSAVESLLDPVLKFWVPFYSESKIIFFLYLVSSSTRGSSTIYRHFIHPTLCNNETEIDLAINKFKSKTVQTLKQWITAAFQKFGGFVTQTAINGGGGLVQSFQKSYSMLDLSDVNNRQRRMFSDEGVILEDEEYSSGPLLKSYKSEEYLHHPSVNPNYASLRKLRSPDFIKSSESLSSGYSTDSFHPSSHEICEEANAEWEEKLDNIVKQMKTSKTKIEGNTKTRIEIKP